MNYKKIFKTRKSRKAVLRLLKFVPDKTMLKVQYRIKLGRKLDLKDPKRFSEKLQWYKINYRDPLMHACVNKFTAREYVKEKGLEDILVKLYGHYENVNAIDWNSLPNSFVLKTVGGGGGLNVVICDDKNKLDINEITEKLETHKKGARGGGREWAYYGTDPGIICEELLINTQNPEAGMDDYKIFCYSGKAKYIVVDTDRYIGHKRNFYDREWNNLHITSDCPACDREIPKPENFNEMLRIAETLAGDFPYVRVDMYNVDGKIYFGELTFYPWSGYVQYTPDDADYLFGKDFELRKYNPEN
ncbi:MAG: carbonic anhydrase [Clostridiales bacterium]|nr:carbonic anhydrase [Clostridiales bacterium]